MTHVEANDILNKFSHEDCPWEQSRSRWCHVHKHYVAFIDYFADTPKSREAVRLCKDEFVRRTGQTVEIATCFEPFWYFVSIYIDSDRREYADGATEHHAIALAIATALKEDRR